MLLFIVTYTVAFYTFSMRRHQDSEINFPPTDLIRAAWTVFTSPGLRIRLGLARSSARFGSRSLFGLTRARFSARDTGTRLARFCSRLVSGCSRSGSARSSAYHSSGTDSVRLSSIHYLGLGSSRLVARAGLETRLGNREIGSMLDLAQLGARLRPSLGPSIGPRAHFQSHFQSFTQNEDNTGKTWTMIDSETSSNNKRR